MPPLPDVPAETATDQQFAGLRSLRAEFNVALFSIPAIQAERIRQLQSSLSEGRSPSRVVFSCEEGLADRAEARVRIAAALDTIRTHLAGSAEDLHRRIGQELAKVPMGPESALQLAASISPDEPGAGQMLAARKSYTDARNEIFLSLEPLRQGSYNRVVAPYRRSADLWQASALGVLRAIERYAPSRGASLPMVVDYFVKCAVADIRRSGPTEAVPVSPTCAHLLFAARTALAEPGRRFDGASLALHLGAPESLGQTLLNLGTLPQEANEDIPDYRHEAPGDALSSQDNRAFVRRILSRLPARKETALRLSFGVGAESKTHAEIAQQLGTKTRAIGMMIQRTLGVLHKHLSHRADDLQ